MSLSWFLFITGIIIVVQGFVYRKWGLSGLKYIRSFSTPAVFEGEMAEMVERILNNKVLPMPWLRVESKISPNLKFSKQSDRAIKHDEFHRSLFSLMPFTGITRRHQILCQRRGCYKLSSVVITYGDAFGMQEIFRTFIFDTELLVYPRLIPLDQIPLPSHSWMGDITVKRWILEDPFIIAGVRDYQYGDPLNRISWKASARTDSLKVFNRDYTADPCIMIMLNIDMDESMWEAVTDIDWVERGISYSASIAQYAIENGIPVGFGCNGYQIDAENQLVRIEPKAGREHLTYIFEALAKLVIARSCTFFTFLEKELELDGSPMDILLITAYTSERMDEQILKLRQKGHSVDIIQLGLVNKDRESEVV